MVKKNVIVKFILAILLIIAIIAISDTQVSAVFRFAMTADTKDDDCSMSGNVGVNPYLDEMVRDMKTLGAQVFLCGGDLVHGGTGGPHGSSQTAQFAKWNELTSAFEGARYMVPGNRDIRPLVCPRSVWQSAFSYLPDNGPAGEQGLNYYVDFGNTRIIASCDQWDTNPDGSTTWPTNQTWVNKDWLEEILTQTENEGFEHIFVLGHTPGHAGDFHRLVAHGVDAYFCGDLHSYVISRPEGDNTTLQAIVGTGGYRSGSGFLLVEVDGPMVTAKYYKDLNGDGYFLDVADSFVITVPEPTILTLLSIASAGVFLRRRRQKHN